MGATYTLPKLTDRQLGILRLLMCGFQNKVISEISGLSEGTVKNHFKNMYDITGMGNRTELALWFVAHEKEYEVGGQQ